MRSRVIEVIVGLFMLAGMAALLVMALKVSGLTGFIGRDAYDVSASFDNVGGLKVRAPVSIAGVHVGEVTGIELNSKTFKAVVTMRLDGAEKEIPTDTAASIQTSGLLGANYVSLTPGFDETVLKEGGVIEITHPALILENLIGQFLFSVKDKSDKK